MSLKSELNRWQEQTLTPLAKRFPERKTEFETPSGIPLPALLVPEDVDEEYLDQLGFPGEFPFSAVTTR